MQINKCIGCQAFSCTDVNKNAYIIPDIDVKPDDISIIMISESSPENRDDYYYAKGNPKFQQTTVLVFNDAGINVSSIEDILNLGVYLTTAVKCAKTNYGLKATTIRECSKILEKELDLFPNVKAYLLMGDVAIKAFNYISGRMGEGRVIPSGSTYKIRKQKFYLKHSRVFPSYLQVGPGFNIEKSKRKIISEDIASAMKLV